jgi:hypothetical protein
MQFVIPTETSHAMLQSPLQLNLLPYQYSSSFHYANYKIIMMIKQRKQDEETSLMGEEL